MLFKRNSQPAKPSNQKFRFLSTRLALATLLRELFKFFLPQSAYAFNYAQLGNLIRTAEPRREGQRQLSVQFSERVKSAVRRRSMARIIVLLPTQANIYA